MSKNVHHAVEIAASADAAWAVFSRTQDWPRWFPTLQRLERSMTGSITLGESIVLHLALFGRGGAVTVRVKEVAPHRVRWVGGSFGVTGDHAFYVERIDDRRCRFVSDETFSGLPVRLIPKRVFGLLERETAEGLTRFRRLVET
jgi:hypothetical protein